MRSQHTHKHNNKNYVQIEEREKPKGIIERHSKRQLFVFLHFFLTYAITSDHSIS